MLSFTRALFSKYIPIYQSQTGPFKLTRRNPGKGEVRKTPKNSNAKRNPTIASIQNGGSVDLSPGVLEELPLPLPGRSLPPMCPKLRQAMEREPDLACRTVANVSPRSRQAGPP